MGLLDAEDQQKEMRKIPRLCAVFLEDYCWKHLSEEMKTNYTAKIEGWVDQGHSLEGANLYKVELPQAELNGADLHGAYLWGTYLNGADLSGANLQDAILQEANLKHADCRRANLRWANLQKAYLSRIKLQGAFLTGILWNEAQYFSLQNLGRIERVGEEINKDWGYAQDAYRRLKNYFHQQGRYSDEAKAHYREKLMTQREAWRMWKFGSWFVLFLLNTLAGFGEKLWKTVVSAFITIFFFAGIYWWGTNAGWGKLVHGTAGHIKDFWHCLYFSVVTFATLGFGDIAPAFSSKAAIAAVFEVILGYVFLGMLITIIARKFGR